jgi:hypothetical protein
VVPGHQFDGVGTGRRAHPIAVEELAGTAVEGLAEMVVAVPAESVEVDLLGNAVADLVEAGSS